MFSVMLSSAAKLMVQVFGNNSKNLNQMLIDFSCLLLMNYNFISKHSKFHCKVKQSAPSQTTCMTQFHPIAIQVEFSIPSLAVRYDRRNYACRIMWSCFLLTFKQVPTAFICTVTTNLQCVTVILHRRHCCKDVHLLFLYNYVLSVYWII